MNEDALAQCQDQLAQVKKEYEEFVYLISHDLNAPIRAITNLSAWIAEDLGTDIPDEVKQNIILLQERSRSLERMLGAILTLSRVSRFDLEVGYIQLLPFLEKIAQKFENQQVKISITNSLPGLTTYFQKLQTVLEELIKNAIVHSDKEKVIISIDITYQGNYLTFNIADNGPGLPEELKEKVFLIFYTAKGKEDNENVGAGLTLAKSISKFVGGNLSLTGSLEGLGCNFVLQWPLEAAEKI